MFKFLAILIFITLATPVSALQVKELYTMDPTNRAWYLAGVFDANLVQWNDSGKRSDCIETLSFKGFNKLLSDLIVSLPEDPDSKERKVYDEMNVATLSWMLIEKECQ